MTDAFEALPAKWRNRIHNEYTSEQVAYQAGVDWAADKLEAALADRCSVGKLECDKWPNGNCMTHPRGTFPERSAGEACKNCGCTEFANRAGGNLCGCTHMRSSHKQPAGEAVCDG